MGPLRRWTPLFVATPARYIDTDYDWASFDLRHWSARRYEWEQDAWGGLKDAVSPVRETIERGRGDCDDYARVALSALYADAAAGRRQLGGLGVCFLQLSWWPPLAHIIAYTDARTFDVGRVRTETVNEYLARTDHVWATTRPVTLPR